MCPLTTVDMELLTEFAGLAFRDYKHGTPDGVQESVLQIFKRHPPTTGSGIFRALHEGTESCYGFADYQVLNLVRAFV